MEMASSKVTQIYEKYAHIAYNYDVIIGYITNDSIYTELSCSIDKTLTKELFIGQVKFTAIGVFILMKAVMKFTSRYPPRQ